LFHSLSKSQELPTSLMEVQRVLKAHMKAALCGLLILAACPALFAQKLPLIEAWGGYSHLRYEAKPLGFSDQLDLNGWNGGVSLPDLYQGFGIAADVSGHYTKPMEVFNFLIGPQYSYQWKGVRPYGHLLIGKARVRLRQLGASTQFEPSDLARSVAFGGGLDLPFTSRIWIRAVQADYMITSNFGGTQHDIRLSTGVIVRFGKR